MKTKRAQLWMVALLVGLVGGGCPACSDDDGNGTGDANDHNSNDGRDTADTGSGADAGTDVPSNNGSDTGVNADTASSGAADSEVEQNFRWNYPKDMNWDEAVASAYGDATVQVVETDFDTSVVDLTLSGLNADLPAPTVDCLDPRITQSCISVSGVDRAGQHFELLCIGAGVSVGSSVVQDFDNPEADTWITRLGGKCRTLRVTEPVQFGATVLAWDSVPAIFDETVMPGTTLSTTIYVHWALRELENSPWSSAGAPYQDGPLRMHGWVRHAANEFGEPGAELMEGVFAGSWNDVEPAYGIRLRGTIKAYLTR
ncbi:MAG: hypothetical protein M0R76_13415 [Proteobacteria bacterium]|nr:hypothetical protein [Pseudomonadota bacterium]